MQDTLSTSSTEEFRKSFSQSAKRHEQAKQLFPNGVTHDLRYLEPFPIYVDRARGAYKWCIDGHRLIDYWSGHGSLLLGHGHPGVVNAVQKQVERGTHPGACHELELKWGEWVQRLIPSAEMMRFVASGTEATLMAIRLARMFTGRSKVLKFAGHFHGWNDFLIPAADPPFDASEIPGIPADVVATTVVIPPNDLDQVEESLKKDDQIGCVVLEPTGGHFGEVPIGGDFLRGLRELTNRYDRLLIFDEVITGFRVNPGGAQKHFGVAPDLTTLAKVLAGGLPGGCVAGRRDILNAIAFRSGKPKMKHPGTFNANPLSAVAGCAALSAVSTGEPCRIANENARMLRCRLNEMFCAEKHDWVAYGTFSDWRLIPDYIGTNAGSDDVVPYDGDFIQLTKPKKRDLMYAFRCGMLLNGVDVPGFGGMTTSVHSESDIEQTIEATAKTLALLKREELA